MDKLKLHTPDFAEANIAKLAELFPDCVTEVKDEGGNLKDEHGGLKDEKGRYSSSFSLLNSSLRYAIDFDLLRQELSSSIVEGPQERYQLNWPGKREALLTANAPIAKTLRPCREESVDFDSTQNLYIEGDNLDALKLLQETYLNKVKLIYIDPPYNTGNDFIYEDDFAEDSESYLLKSNQKDEVGNRLVANNDSNGRFHSDWLSMMYSRLKLARNLLKDDGVIFISIDDNEQACLKRICDEIFGDENFVSQIIWQRSKKGDAKLISKVHEYILCYAKNKVAVIEAGVWRRKKEGAAEVLAQYAEFKTQYLNDHEKIRSAMQEWFRSLPDSDPRKAHKHYNWSDDKGLYFAADFAGPDDGRASRPRHDILHPITGMPCKKPSTGWRWDEAKTKWALEQVPPRIHFGPDETTIPNRKSYLEEISVEPYPSIFYRDGRSATLEVEGLVGKGVFQFPKNTDVLSEIISLATQSGDLILDFFAGSGSTGHAILNLNVNDQGKRKFILVQIPESCEEKSAAFKAGYQTISDVCKTRIGKAGQKIKRDNADKPGIEQLDIGFRVLKVDSSNMNPVFYAPDQISQSDLHEFAENIRSDRDEEDLLFQVLLDWGVDLSLPITRETIAGKSVLFVDDNALAACFDNEGGITEEFVKQLAARQPLRVVFRDGGFASDSVKINIEQIFKLLSPSTDIKTI